MLFEHVYEAQTTDLALDVRAWSLRVSGRRLYGRTAAAAH